jgi:two-component system chemotaxis response regulator CheY
MSVMKRIKEEFMNKVLIADDAKLMRDIIQDVVAEIGQFEIIIAHNGKDAVQLYKKHKPDLVTMDITMEEKNGLEATEEIVQFDPAAKIIVVTALGQEKLLNACLATGARDFIVKPFTRERILSAVRNCLEEECLESQTSLINSQSTG